MAVGSRTVAGKNSGRPLRRSILTTFAGGRAADYRNTDGAIRQAAVRRARETRPRFGAMRNWPRQPGGRPLVYQPRKSPPFRRWTSRNTQCGLSCRAGTGDRRPRSPGSPLHTSTQRWLHGRTVAMATTTKSRSRSSESRRNSKPRLLASIVHGRTVAMARRWQPRSSAKSRNVHAPHSLRPCDHLLHVS